MKTNTTKKVISILLSIFMLITMAPLSAFAVEEYNEIKPGETYTVTKQEYVKFVPDESGTFIIRSVSDVDPMVTLYDSNMEQLAGEDDSDYRENGYDFYLKYEYTAGETYYFQFYDHDEEYNYTVILVAPCSEHIDEDEDAFCDVCGDIIVNNIKNEIKVGETYTVTKQEYVKFVPDESGTFIIRSVSDVDPKVWLYDSNMLLLTEEDDSDYSENGRDFYFEYEYTAGETYYFQFYDHYGAYNYTVILVAPCTEHTGGTQTCKGYQCEACGEWYGEAGEQHIDEDENGLCDVCDEFSGNEIKVGETYTVTKEEYVKFVPTESGTFIIRSVSDVDPMVRLYDSNMEQLAGEDDSDYREENNLDFSLKYEYTAGETYYFEFFDHAGEYNYTVILIAPCTEHTGGTQTCKGYQCEACGEYFGEADADKHSFTNYVEVEAPECEKAGKKLAVCNNGCGATDEKEIPALEHTPLEAAKENEVYATCKAEGGYDLVVYCDLCGEEIDSEHIITEKLLHTPSGWWATTETEHYKHCVNDSCSEEIEGTRAAHSYTWEVITEATATTDGEETGTCECGYETTRVIPATGETPDEPTDDTCDHMCHKSGFMGFIWKIVRFFQKLFRINPVCECGVAHY